MIKFSSKLSLVILLGFLAFSMPAPQAKAMEPISMAMMLAPIAIPIIKAALPYILKGAVNMAGAMFECGVEMFNMLLVPLSFFEMTIGGFWFFDSGVIHLIDGCIAFPKSMLLMFMVLPKTIGIM